MDQHRTFDIPLEQIPLHEHVLLPDGSVRELGTLMKHELRAWLDAGKRRPAATIKLYDGKEDS